MTPTPLLPKRCGSLNILSTPRRTRRYALYGLTAGEIAGIYIPE